MRSHFAGRDPLPQVHSHTVGAGPARGRQRCGVISRAETRSHKITPTLWERALPAKAAMRSHFAGRDPLPQIHSHTVGAGSAREGSDAESFRGQRPAPTNSLPHCGSGLCPRRQRCGVISRAETRSHKFTPALWERALSAKAAMRSHFAGRDPLPQVHSRIVGAGSAREGSDAESFPRQRPAPTSSLPYCGSGLCPRRLHRTLRETLRRSSRE